MARGVNTKANGIDFRANRFDEFLKLIPQNLTDAEKAQVMANLGITPTPGSLDGAVRYDAAQTLNDEQKSQARNNIGAIDDSLRHELYGYEQKDYDLSTFEQKSYIPYLDSGLWQLSGAKHIVIPVVPRQKYRFVGISEYEAGKGGTQYACLKSYSVPSQDDEVDFCEGYSRLVRLSESEEVTLTIPSDCNFLVFAAYRNYDMLPVSFERIYTGGDIQDIQGDIQDIQGDIQDIQGKIIDVNDKTIDLTQFEQKSLMPNAGLWQLSGVKHIAIQVVPGDVYTFIGHSDSSIGKKSEYWLLDTYSVPSSNDEVDYCEGYSDDFYVDYGVEERLVVPEGCHWLIIKAYHNANVLPTDFTKIGKYSDLTQTMNAAFPYREKKILLLGDSLTEFKGVDGYGYSDYLQEMMKADIINCGIGGTCLRQRRQLTTIFDAVKTYSVGDWVLRKENDEYKWYEFTSNHTGEWSDDDVTLKSSSSYIYANLDIVNLVTCIANNDFDDAEAVAEYVNSAAAKRVIATLKSIDMDEIDAVTVFAGTNGWGASLGTSGSFDIMTTLGAVNTIVKKLLESYPHVKLYWFTPVIRWKDINEDGSFVPEGFSDIYQQGGYTLKQWSNAIKDEVALNHIPCCDMYNTLGWNKYNFWQYFCKISLGDQLNDGTHPRKGFKQIAERMSAFIVSNL